MHSLSRRIGCVANQKPCISTPGVRVHVDAHASANSALIVHINRRGRICATGDSNEPPLVVDVHCRGESKRLRLEPNASPRSLGETLRALLPRDSRTPRERLLVQMVTLPEMSVREFRAQQTFLERNSMSRLEVYGVHDSEPRSFLRTWPLHVQEAYDSLSTQNPSLAGLMFGMARLSTSVCGGVFFGTGVACERAVWPHWLDQGVGLVVVRESPSLDMSRLSPVLLAANRSGQSFLKWAVEQTETRELGEMLNIYWHRDPSTPFVKGVFKLRDFNVRVLELAQTNEVVEQDGTVMANLI